MWMAQPLKTCKAQHCVVKVWAEETTSSPGDAEQRFLWVA